MNLDQPLFTTMYCCSEEFIVLCRQNKIVQCLICEQKCLSIIFVFFTCTEIKNCTYSVNYNYTWIRSPSLNMSRGKQIDDFFLCNYLYRPVYARFIIKVFRVDFFVFIESFYWNAGWKAIGFWDERLCSWDYKNTFFLYVLSIDNVTFVQTRVSIKYMTFKTKNKPESPDSVYCTTNMLHK